MSEEEKRAIEKLQTKYEKQKRINLEQNQFIDSLKTNIIKLQKENIELKTKLEIEKTDNLYNKEEANEEMIPKHKIRKEIKELEEMNVRGMLFETAVFFAKLILKNILEDNK